MAGPSGWSLRRRAQRPARSASSRLVTDTVRAAPAEVSRTTLPVSSEITLVVEPEPATDPEVQTWRGSHATRSRVDPDDNGRARSVTQ